MVVKKVGVCLDVKGCLVVVDSDEHERSLSSCCVGKETVKKDTQRAIVMLNFKFAV